MLRNETMNLGPVMQVGALQHVRPHPPIKGRYFDRRNPGGGYVTKTDVLMGCPEIIGDAVEPVLVKWVRTYDAEQKSKTKVGKGSKKSTVVDGIYKELSAKGCRFYGYDKEGKQRGFKETLAQRPVKDWLQKQLSDRVKAWAALQRAPTSLKSEGATAAPTPTPTTRLVSQQVSQVPGTEIQGKMPPTLDGVDPKPMSLQFMAVSGALGFPHAAAAPKTKSLWGASAVPSSPFVVATTAAPMLPTPFMTQPVQEERVVSGDVAGLAGCPPPVLPPPETDSEFGRSFHRTTSGCTYSSAAFLQAQEGQVVSDKTVAGDKTNGVSEEAPATADGGTTGGTPPAAVDEFGQVPDLLSDDLGHLDQLVSESELSDFASECATNSQGGSSMEDDGWLPFPAGQWVLCGTTKEEEGLQDAVIEDTDDNSLCSFSSVNQVFFSGEEGHDGDTSSLGGTTITTVVDNSKSDGGEDDNAVIAALKRKIDGMIEVQEILSKRVADLEAKRARKRRRCTLLTTDNEKFADGWHPNVHA